MFSFNNIRDINFKENFVLLCFNEVENYARVYINIVMRDLAFHQHVITDNQTNHSGQTGTNLFVTVLVE